MGVDVRSVEGTIFDIKGVDPVKHRRTTGFDTAKIHANLERLADLAADRITASVPVIPGQTDTESEIAEIAVFLSGLSISRMRLLGYHDFGRGKYEEPGRDYLMEPAVLPSPEDLDRFREVARKAGVEHVF